MGGSHAKIMRELADIVGPENVSDEAYAIIPYLTDMTPEPEGKAEYVVMPKSVCEIQKIVKLANREGIPITPFSAGTNVGGLSIPRKGGIVLDLRRMNKIIRIDEDSMIAIVEPGVTFGQLSKEIERLGFRYPIPAGPHNASVVCNALLEGHGNLSVLCGAQSDNIVGLEVVLPDGELIRLGSCALSPYWFSRYPLPDLMGLFIGWQGTTGIVTKMGIKLMPKREHIDLIVLEHMDIDSFGDFAIELSRTRAFDACVSYTWAMQMAAKFIPKEPLPAKGRDEGDMYTYITITGLDEEELELRRRIVGRVCKKYEEKGLLRAFVISEEEKKAILTLPSRKGWVGWSTRRGGGLTWIGTYSPLSLWPTGIKGMMQIEEKYGLDPMVITRVIDFGHYGMLRAIIPYDKEDPDEVKRCRNAMVELAEYALKLGAIIYKPPSWAAEMMWGKADPGFVKLMKLIKRAIDPKGIMNPGRLGL